MGYQRTPLVSVHSDILSSYDYKHRTGGPRSELKPLRERRCGKAPLDVAETLRLAHIAVTRAGGDFRVTDLNRHPDISDAARARFLNWHRVGEPPRKLKNGQDNSAYDRKTMKDAYVSPGGYSMHNGARAVDLHIDMVKLPVAPDQQLDALWAILEPLNMFPIIKHPREGKKESWHFNIPGVWIWVHKRFGSERITAMCCSLDIGLDCYDRWEWRFVQAQMQRGGYDCGEPDGWPGRKKGVGSKKMGKTRRALQELGFDHLTDDPSSLFISVSAVPDAKLIWMS